MEKKTKMKLSSVMPFRRRVGSWIWKKDSQKKYSKYRVVAYVDSRDVMDRLDSAVWPENRQRVHKEISWQIYCGVSLKEKDGTRVTKRDVGSRSNIEWEKWASSDSFKRACVNRGIGRFLYTVPSLIITKQEMMNNYYNITEFVKKRFRDKLENWYNQNSIKMDHLESKYEEQWEQPIENKDIDEQVDLKDRE